jgi:flagellar hook-length control protein FliK
MALRVLLAWSMSEAEPTDAALRAALGDAPDLSDALETLGKVLGQEPERFPAVATFLAAIEPETPLLPRQLGLERHTPASGNPPSATTLAEALATDLGAALVQGRPEDAQVLRDALRSLASEGFGAARDPRDPTSSSPWSLAPRQDRPDSGKVVVHDRRRHRDDPSRGTVVDVAMDPSGLGGVDARLELRGRDLDVRFSTREQETARTISDNLPQLRKLLLGLGFEPRELDARAGKSRVRRPSPHKGDGGGALDIRA